MVNVASTARLAVSFVVPEGTNSWGQPATYWLKTAADQVVAGPFRSHGEALQVQIVARRKAWGAAGCP